MAKIRLSVSGRVAENKLFRKACPAAARAIYEGLFEVGNWDGGADRWRFGGSIGHWPTLKYHKNPLTVIPSQK